MHLQLYQNTLILPEDKPPIEKIIGFKTVVKISSVDKIISADNTDVSIRVGLQLEHQLTYISQTSKERVYIVNNTEQKIMYLASIATTPGELNEWLQAKYIEGNATVEAVEGIMLNRRKVFNYALISVVLQKVKLIEAEGDNRDE